MEHDGNNDDPFASLKLDETFVRRAATKELSAEDRKRRDERIKKAEDELAVARRNKRIANRPHRKLNRWLKRSRKPIIIVTVVALLGVYIGWRATSGPAEQWSTQNDAAATKADGTRPTPQKANSLASLGNPDLSDINAGPYQFMAQQSGSAAPIAYDPCRPIQVVLNNRTAPKDGDAIVRDALMKISGVTGLQFVIEGTSDEKPVSGREAFQAARYGDRWAPVLIAWTDSQELPELAGDVVGTGGSSHATALPTGPEIYVSGMVALDGPDLKDLIGSNGKGETEAVVMHELGHLVGLEHVSDKTQIMNPEGNWGVVNYGRGDRAGLARLGQGACAKQL